jgi:hypothetical protein
VHRLVLRIRELSKAAGLKQIDEARAQPVR